MFGKGRQVCGVILPAAKVRSFIRTLIPSGLVRRIPEPAFRSTFIVAGACVALPDLLRGIGVPVEASIQIEPPVFPRGAWLVQPVP